MGIPSIQTQDFLYDLPAARIAQHPLANRDASRLLVAHLGDRTIEDRGFAELPGLLPEGSLLVMNDSRVVPARLPVFKSTGGAAEIFLLDPISPSQNPAITLQQGSPSEWNCLIGGKRIHEGDELTTADGKLKARVLSRDHSGARVALSWSPPSESLASLLEALGKLPLPPYMKREVVREDFERYQTVYADAAGSVAAPTAGLHFTPAVLEGLSARSIHTARLTLHVGAGTFKPVEAATVDAHTMHRERFEVTPEFLNRVALQLSDRPSRAPLIAVGTTSLRTLESLYWLGVLWLQGHEPEHLDQWTAYSLLDSGADRDVSAPQALDALSEYLARRNQPRLVATTSLMIVPGYRFQTASRLLTNFHQPGSSLILLVAAWAGDRWREIYEHALRAEYRFLSYGDSSLLIRS